MPFKGNSDAKTNLPASTPPIKVDEPHHYLISTKEPIEVRMF